LTTGGSSTVHISTQTIHRTVQSTQKIHRTPLLTEKEECGRCPVFASSTLVFAFTTEEKARKDLSQGSRRVPVGTMKQNIQNRTYITIRIHKHNKDTQLTELNKIIQNLQPSRQ
jgi:hypothetical protein